jgi:hypothetical protein
MGTVWRTLTRQPVVMGVDRSGSIGRTRARRPWRTGAGSGVCMVYQPIVAICATPGKAAGAPCRTPLEPDGVVPIVRDYRVNEAEWRDFQ